jgi:hypothetical protein
VSTSALRLILAVPWPQEELTKTENAQPAILSHSIAAFRSLQAALDASSPGSGTGSLLSSCSAAMGHSVGEYAGERVSTCWCCCPLLCVHRMVFCVSVSISALCAAGVLSLADAARLTVRHQLVCSPCLLVIHTIRACVRLSVRGAWP